jgi:hypothetical protein
MFDPYKRGKINSLISKRGICVKIFHSSQIQIEEGVEFKSPHHGHYNFLFYTVSNI